MKKVINAFTAAAVALAFVLGSPSARAGSLASVDQVGDANYTVVIQKKNNTLTRSWTAASPFEARKLQRRVDNIVEQVTKPRRTKAGKMGGAGTGGHGCGFGSVANASYVSQAGYGNTAFASQTGSNNVAVTSQDGNNNASYIVQKGSGNEAYATQSGNDNVSVIVQRC